MGNVGVREFLILELLFLGIRIGRKQHGKMALLRRD